MKRNGCLAIHHALCTSFVLLLHLVGGGKERTTTSPFSCSSGQGSHFFFVSSVICKAKPYTTRFFLILNPTLGSLFLVILDVASLIRYRHRPLLVSISLSLTLSREMRTSSLTPTHTLLCLIILGSWTPLALDARWGPHAFSCPSLFCHLLIASVGFTARIRLTRATRFITCRCYILQIPGHTSSL